MSAHPLVRNSRRWLQAFAAWQIRQFSAQAHSAHVNAP